jgi:hypothetical protein
MQPSQVETPPGGTNHREAQNTENTGAIVAQLPAISNSQHNSVEAEISANADDYVRELAKGNNAKLLAKAANYASMHAHAMATAHETWSNHRVGADAVARHALCFRPSHRRQAGRITSRSTRNATKTIAACAYAASDRASKHLENTHHDQFFFAG